VTEHVIIVNVRDEIIGVEEKIKAHSDGVLHRAFSIFIFNAAGQLLLQQRAHNKYHSKGLWSNTCCGHPRPGESIVDASLRRLSEEMGFVCEVRESFKFIYRAEVGDGLVEHEYDHVLVGRFDGDPAPNSDEVDDWKWVDLTTLQLNMREDPDIFTYWFRLSLGALCRPAEPVPTDVRPEPKR
jgi:isopentenyl-diphosphate delta-isomerase